MDFVVTGATSFIGVELTRHLLAHGHRVMAVCRPGPDVTRAIPAGAEIVLSDMAGYGHLHDRIPKADVFVSLAWGGTGHEGRNAAEVQRGNVLNTVSAFLAAGKMGCGLFVEAGSQAEYGSTSQPQSEVFPCRPFSEYGRAKLKVKEELFRLSEETGMKYIHLRIFCVYGEDDHPWTLVMSAVDRMLRSERVDLSPCTQNWNFIYVKDAVRVIRKLCERAAEDKSFCHEVYNVASEDTRVLKDFLRRMKELTGSGSELRFGAVMPTDIVSLQPDMGKTREAVGTISEHTFDEVIGRIVESKLRGLRKSALPGS